MTDKQSELVGAVALTFTGLHVTTASGSVVAHNDAVRAVFQAIEELGYVVVPREPTEEMVRAGVRAVGRTQGCYDDKMRGWYRASIDAAPK